MGGPYTGSRIVPASRRRSLLFPALPDFMSIASPAARKTSQPTPTPLEALAERGEVRRYRRGALLIQEGDRGDTIYIILSGRLRAFGTNEKGREITYGTYGPGEYIGEMSLDGGLRSASVIALETTECSVVTRRTLEQYIGDNPGFAFELISKVIRRARAATLSAKQLALNDVYGRLVALLQGLAVTRPDGTKVIRGISTHREMASSLGCSREMVSRLMKDLEAGGYVLRDDEGWRIEKAFPGRW